jgi:hypothetical protein
VVFHLNRLAHRTRRVAKVPRRECFTHHRSRTWFLAEDGEEFGIHPPDPRELGPVAQLYSDFAAEIYADGVEGFCRCAKVHKISTGNTGRAGGAAGALCVQADDAVGFGESQRLQQHAVYDAEHRGTASDAQTQRHNRKQREAGVPAQL